MTSNVVGSYLRRKRIEADITQLALSKALGYSSTQYISNWERGVCATSDKIYPKLVDVLNLDKTEFMEQILMQTKMDLNNLLFGRSRVKKSIRRK